jgi:hypothetical protein
MNFSQKILWAIIGMPLGVMVFFAIMIMLARYGIYPK